MFLRDCPSGPREKEERAHTSGDSCAHHPGKGPQARRLRIPCGRARARRTHPCAALAASSACAPSRRPDRFARSGSARVFGTRPGKAVCGARVHRDNGKGESGRAKPAKAFVRRQSDGRAPAMSVCAKATAPRAGDVVRLRFNVRQCAAPRLRISSLNPVSYARPSSVSTIARGHSERAKPLRLSAFHTASF